MYVAEFGVPAISYITCCCLQLPSWPVCTFLLYYSMHSFQPLSRTPTSKLLNAIRSNWHFRRQFKYFFSSEIFDSNKMQTVFFRSQSKDILIWFYRKHERLLAKQTFVWNFTKHRPLHPFPSKIKPTTFQIDHTN